MGRYAHKESNFEHEVIEAVIDTNYRRLIDGRPTIHWEAFIILLLAAILTKIFKNLFL